MSPELFLDVAIRPAFVSLLPPRMRSPAARAMVLAVCLQESGLVYRAQLSGPARGFAQFEVAGCAGVLAHPASGAHALRVCERLTVLPSAHSVLRAMEYGDVLAVAFARLLLWTLPAPLPDRDEVDEGWRQYLDAWRPGKPRPATWANHFDTAWSVVATDGLEPVTGTPRSSWGYDVPPATGH